MTETTMALNQELKRRVQMNRLPHDTTKIFTDIWQDAGEFLEDYKDNGIPTTISESSLNTLFYLLYARHGNSAIANLDETQWKYRVFTVIFQYGPTWEKKLDIQQKLRDISDEDLLKGSKAIYNHAFNPSTEPATLSLAELEYINDQSTTNYKKSKMDAYTQLIELLETDVTGAFLDKFKPLFAKFVYTKPDIYVTELDDEEGE